MIFLKLTIQVNPKKIILINLKYNEEFKIAPVVIKQYIKRKEPLSPSERRIFLFRKRLTSKELEDIETLRKEFPLKDDMTLFFIKREVSLIPIDYSKTVYKNNSTYVELRCITHNKVYFQRPHNLLSGECGCPDCNINSRGESLVDKWLNYADLKFTAQYCPETVPGRNKDAKVYIDFKIIYNGLEYWIEYNGEQHYSNIHFFNRTYDDFLEQIERDENVRNYCRLNNIILVEIPYLYSDYSSISDILERIIIRGEDPLDIINLPKINKNEN